MDNLAFNFSNDKLMPKGMPIPFSSATNRYSFTGVPKTFAETGTVSASKTASDLGRLKNLATLHQNTISTLSSKLTCGSITVQELQNLYVNMVEYESCLGIYSLGYDVAEEDILAVVRELRERDVDITEPRVVVDNYQRTLQGMGIIYFTAENQQISRLTQRMMNSEIGLCNDVQAAMASGQRITSDELSVLRSRLDAIELRTQRLRDEGIPDLEAEAFVGQMKSALLIYNSAVERVDQLKNGDTKTEKKAALGALAGAKGNLDSIIMERRIAIALERTQLTAGGNDAPETAVRISQLDTQDAEIIVLNDTLQVEAAKVVVKVALVIADDQELTDIAKAILTDCRERAISEQAINDIDQYIMQYDAQILSVQEAQAERDGGDYDNERNLDWVRSMATGFTKINPNELFHHAAELSAESVMLLAYSEDQRIAKLETDIPFIINTLT